MPTTQLYSRNLLTTEAIRSLAGKLGLHMSFKKTELMTIGKSTASAYTPSSTPIVPLGNEGNIKVVEHFKYLAAFCSADGTIGKELNNRIGRAAGSFRELEKIWKDRYLNLRFYSSCVLSTLLYAAECLSLTERDEARLDAFDMRCQRKILRIKWTQHTTNKQVRTLTNQPPLTKHHQKTQIAVVWSLPTNGNKSHH